MIKVIVVVASEQSESMLEMEVRRADAIAMVFAADDPDSLDSITDHWLPLIERTLGAHHTTPVIVVGNKVDLVDYSTMDAVLPILNEFEEVETCVECSAKTLKNISEMFYFAQKAVLHPSAPLWNYHERELTAKCEKCLGRVFELCDEDGDSLLSDHELAVFQRRCFRIDLETGTLDSLKEVVRRNCEHGGIRDDSLTLRGFLVLNALFIQRGRHETTWTILRRFGYDDDLTLSRDYLFPPLNVPHSSTVELSHEGLDFFKFLFHKYDRDKDQCLSPQELVNLFSTCPVMPFGPDIYHSVPTDPDTRYLGLKGFIALWSLTTLREPRKSLEYLAYLGYPFFVGEDSQLSAVHITKDPLLDLAKRGRSSRNVFRCVVLGSPRAGKTSFCQTLLNRTRSHLRELNVRSDELPTHVINSVMLHGEEKWLVLEDVSSLRVIGGGCDACLLLYDVSDPRSFETVARIYLKLFANSEVPVLIVGAKADQVAVRQNYVLQPAAFCLKHKLPPPELVSSVKAVRSDIFVKIVSLAALSKQGKLGVTGSVTDLIRGTLLGLTTALLVVGGIAVYRNAKEGRGLQYWKAVLGTFLAPKGID